MQNLNEDQVAFLSTHHKLLKYISELANSHNDNAAAAIADLKLNAFPIQPEGREDDATPRKATKEGCVYESTVTDALPISEQQSPKKRYKIFCKECVALFTDGSSVDLSQNEALFLFPCTIYDMYLGTASESELSLLKLIRKLKKKEARLQLEVEIAQSKPEEVSTTKNEQQIQELTVKNEKLEEAIVQLEASVSELVAENQLLIHDKKVSETKIQRLNDELAAIHRRNNQKPELDTHSATSHKEPQNRASVSPQKSLPMPSSSKNHPSSNEIMAGQAKTKVVKPPADDDDDDEGLLVVKPTAILGTKPPNLSNNVRNKPITTQTKNRKACAKCGKGGHLFACQRCDQRFHEACGGPYAKDEDEDDETTDKIIRNENEAVIQFLTENGEYGASQFDHQHIDEVRNRKLCQMYCRTCRREQGIVSDGSSASSSSDKDDNDDHSSWSTDSSDIREEELRVALDISRFPQTQESNDDLEDEEILSISSTTSSQRRQVRKEKKLEKARKKLQKKLLKKNNNDDSDGFVSSDEDDWRTPYAKSRYVLDEAEDAHSSDSDLDETKQDRENGLEKHKKKTANRIIKANHKRRRKTKTSTSDEDEGDKRKPVLDQEDLNVLDILGLEVPQGIKVKKERKSKKTRTEDQSPAGRTREQAVEISQSQDSTAAVSPQRQYPATAARQQAILNSLRFVNPNALVTRQQQPQQASTNRPVNRMLGGATTAAAPEPSRNDDFWGTSPGTANRPGPEATNESELLFPQNGIANPPLPPHTTGTTRPDSRLLFSTSNKNDSKGLNGHPKRGF